MPSNKDHYAITAIFIQDVWSIADPVTLTFGTRWYEFASDARVFGNPSQETRRIEREWCPKVRLDHEFDDSLSLYASVSREMRMP
jgi:outer membrane receptor protein involved in Fe transport